MGTNNFLLSHLHVASNGGSWPLTGVCLGQSPTNHSYAPKEGGTGRAAGIERLGHLCEAPEQRSRDAGFEPRHSSPWPVPLACTLDLALN